MGIPIASGATDVKIPFVIRDSTNHAVFSAAVLSAGGTNAAVFYRHVSSAAIVSTAVGAAAAITAAHSDGAYTMQANGVCMLCVDDAAFAYPAHTQVVLSIAGTGMDPSFARVDIAPPVDVSAVTLVSGTHVGVVIPTVSSVSSLGASAVTSATMSAAAISAVQSGLSTLAAVSAVGTAVDAVASTVSATQSTLTISAIQSGLATNAAVSASQTAITTAVSGVADQVSGTTTAVGGVANQVSGTTTAVSGVGTTVTAMAPLISAMNALVITGGDGDLAAIKLDIAKVRKGILNKMVISATTGAVKLYDDDNTTEIQVGTPTVTDDSTAVTRTKVL